MITLEFKIDEAEWQSDVAASPTTANPAALEQTYFVMPVRFTVQGKELLGIPGVGPWQRLPMLGLAWGFGRVAHLSTGDKVNLSLAGGGNLEFRAGADAVTVTSSLRHESVEVDAEELRHSAGNFVESVRREFRKRLPSMSSHPAWSTWFGG